MESWAGPLDDGPGAGGAGGSGSSLNDPSATTRRGGWRAAPVGTEPHNGSSGRVACSDAAMSSLAFVGAVALAGPLIDAKAESYASDFNGNLDGLISEIQGAFSSMHKQTIADAHEDFEDLVESPEFQAFRDSLPEDQQAKADATIESGSAGAVIKLLQAFKDAKDKPKEKTLEDAWAEDAATSVRSSSPLKVSSRAPMSEDDEYKAAFEAA